MGFLTAFFTAAALFVAPITPAGVASPSVALLARLGHNESCPTRTNCSYRRRTTCKFKQALGFYLRWVEGQLSV